ncbi:MAG TPA: hypothetical protein VER32_06440 [Pyrinomonadaceae bacterium]|nr:hypothetical protein [Pyrinomonadaceae bacterium]
MAAAEVAIQQNTAGGGAAGSVTRADASSVAKGRARWWRRRGSKRAGFWYETHDGGRVTDAEALERIRTLAVPPAWQDVLISPRPKSALQAIGIDAAGRVQRVYHTAFAARRQRRKYEKIVRFGERLPALRQRANEDIARPDLSRERVLAVVVSLINELYFRVGSEESVRRYRTYGVTTLRSRHLEIKRGGQLVFSFTGKHHIRHRRILADTELASLMQEIRSLKGGRLFKYVAEDGRVRAITPRDVNDYIKQSLGPEFSAKDFRTWGGTILAAIELAELGASGDERAAKSNVLRAVRKVAEHLGNTPAVCRSCYVHPAVIESYLKGTTIEEFRPRRERRLHQRQHPEYDPEELALLKLLRAHTNGNAS